MPGIIVDRRIVLTSQSRRFNYLTSNYASDAGITDLTELKAVNVLSENILNNSNIFSNLENGFVNLVSPTSYGASLHDLMGNYTMTSGVAPGYSQNGWSFNGVNQYIKSGFIPSTAMTLNQGFVLISMASSVAGNTQIYAATNAAGTTQWIVGIRSGAGNAFFNAYNSATQMTVANANTAGTFVWAITANNSRYIRRNGAAVGAVNTTVVGGSLPAVEVYIGARNNDGTPGLYTQCAMRTVIQSATPTGSGGPLSTTEADLLQSWVDTYNATVISGGR